MISFEMLLVSTLVLVDTLALPLTSPESAGDVDDDALIVQPFNRVRDRITLWGRILEGINSHAQRTKISGITIKRDAGKVNLSVQSEIIGLECPDAYKPFTDTLKIFMVTSKSPSAAPVTFTTDALYRSVTSTVPTFATSSMISGLITSQEVGTTNSDMIKTVFIRFFIINKR
jgi:hypothetical protein